MNVFVEKYIKLISQFLAYPQGKELGKVLNM